MKPAGLLPISVAVLALGGCQGWQSSLDPEGPQAEALADLFWIFTAVCAAVWMLVVLALLWSLAKRRAERPDPLATDPYAEQRYTVVVSALVGLTGSVLIALTGFSYATQKKLFSDKPPSITLTITGHQWWWEIQYEDAEANEVFTTANEIHVPVGETITVKLTSADVIHSFWVPNLSGKLDLITGRENEFQFAAARPGIYRGQCAEFCGWQHAHMGILFIADLREDYDAWRQAQIAARAEPADEERKRGEQIFLASPCVTCHTVRGTPAGGTVGPDLTHVGSRRTIAAGTLPMSRGNLAAWLVDPQGVKPGAQMPVIPLEPGEIDPLTAYLEGLK